MGTRCKKTSPAPFQVELIAISGMTYCVAIGFNAENLTINNVKFQVWDLGGNEGGYGSGTET
jgi:hypothetical protein